MAGSTATRAEIQAMLRIELLAPDGRPDGDGFAVDHDLGDPDAAGSRELTVEVRGQPAVTRTVTLDGSAGEAEITL